MRHAGQTQRARQPTLEAEAEESEIKELPRRLQQEWLDLRQG